MKHWSRVVRHAWLITQRAVCILFLQVIAPALLHRGISVGRGPVELGPWLYMASTLNVLIPGFRRYFRYAGTGARHYTHDIFQIVIIWLVFRFVWLPLNRLLDYAVFYFQLPCYTDEPFLNTWSLYAACICYLASLYYGDMVGRYWSFDDAKNYSDASPDVYYLPIHKDSVKLLLAGLQEHLPKSKTENRPGVRKCRSAVHRQRQRSTSRCRKCRA
ncbi:hypothetical protein LSAT2_021420 [Lamellibrachia satsuma]|nr:hypothetical protein LSAT2_021420 [Lamellibrachia satsuma]